LPIHFTGPQKLKFLCSGKFIKIVERRKKLRLPNTNEYYFFLKETEDISRIEATKFLQKTMKNAINLSVWKDLKRFRMTDSGSRNNLSILIQDKSIRREREQ